MGSGGFPRTGSGARFCREWVLPRRPGRDVLGRRTFVVPPRRRLLRRVRRVERAEDARAHLGREPPGRFAGSSDRRKDLSRAAEMRYM